LRIISYQHPAFRRSHRFNRMKTKNGKVRPGVTSNFPKVSLMQELSTYRMAGIFNHGRTSLACDGGDSRHFRLLTRIINCHDSFRVALPCPLKFNWIEIVGDRIDLDEVRRGADVSRRVRRGEEGNGRSNNTVARSYPSYSHGQMQ